MITSGKCQIIDENERVLKAILKKAKDELERDLRHYQYLQETHQTKVIAMRGDGKDKESLRIANCIKETKTKLDNLKKNSGTDK